MRRRVWLWVSQVLLAVMIAVLMWRALARNWEELKALDLTLDLRPAWIVAAALAVWGTYGLLIEAWRRVVIGWGETLPFAVGARIWVLSNLGRYLPGKVWSVAGLVILAQRAGVSGWAAAGSAVAMQAVAVGTGVAVVAAVVPGAASPVWLAAAAVLAAATVISLTRPEFARLVTRLKAGLDFRPLSWSAVTVAAAVTALSWVAYGVAFWMLARGLFGAGHLSIVGAVGVFAAGYIIGLLAIFAPGGVGVRELVFIGLLASTLGSANAIALSVASRILLTLTEAGAAGLVLLLRRGPRETKIESA